jgi:hypothetical protein
VAFEKWCHLTAISLRKSQILSTKSQTNSNSQNPNNQNLLLSFILPLEHLRIRISDLPFDTAQGGESFDSAQDREPAERLVEPFRASCFDIRILRFGLQI